MGLPSIGEEPRSKEMSDEKASGEVSKLDTPSDGVPTAEPSPKSDLSGAKEAEKSRDNERSAEKATCLRTAYEPCRQLPKCLSRLGET